MKIRALRIKEGTSTCEVGKLYDIIKAKGNKVEYISDSGINMVTLRNKFLLENEEIDGLDIIKYPDIEFQRVGTDMIYMFKDNMLVMKKPYGWTESLIGFNGFLNVKFTPVIPKEEEVDWSKVKAGTKVQIRFDEDAMWNNAYFVGLVDDNPNTEWKYKYSYTNPEDKFIETDICFTSNYCRLYKEEN